MQSVTCWRASKYRGFEWTTLPNFSLIYDDRPYNPLNTLRPVRTSIRVLRVLTAHRLYLSPKSVIGCKRADRTYT